MRIPVLVLAVAVAALSVAAVSAEDAHTTRIITEPVYGAVVTIEHGVRVYRPVPPTTHLIVNPDGAAPIILGAGARRIVDHRASVIAVSPGR